MKRFLFCFFVFLLGFFNHHQAIAQASPQTQPVLLQSDDWVTVHHPPLSFDCASDKQTKTTSFDISLEFVLTFGFMDLFGTGSVAMLVGIGILFHQSPESREPAFGVWGIILGAVTAGLGIFQLLWERSGPLHITRLLKIVGAIFFTVGAAALSLGIFYCVTLTPGLPPGDTTKAMRVPLLAVPF